MKTAQTEVPEALYNKAVALVNEGWFRALIILQMNVSRRFTV